MHKKLNYDTYTSQWIYSEFSLNKFPSGFVSINVHREFSGASNVTSGLLTAY